MLLSTFDSNNSKNQSHPFHLVDPSPWPFYISFGVFGVVSGLVLWMHDFSDGFSALCSAFVIFLFFLYNWLQDVVIESTYQGHHTSRVIKGLQYGMMLFMVSEVMFFFSFFWSFFYYAINPSTVIGNVWPPQGVTAVNPWHMPLLNTVILLSSGVTLTWGHKELMAGNIKGCYWGLVSTVGLGVIFTFLQAFEYMNTELCMNDSVYGSIFYLATGFHGFHVLIGTIFLVVCLFSLTSYHFTCERHFGLVAASWYWHFVDVVWIFLYFFIYLWGSWNAWPQVG